MLKLKDVFVLGLCIFLTFGCSDVINTPTSSATQLSYPGSELQISPNESSSYPGPTGETQTTGQLSAQDYFVEGLVVPTPIAGKGVVTGVLLERGDSNNPFITSIYLATTSPAETSGEAPQVNYSEETDPIAVQDKLTGQFVFTDVAPGQYALVIWSLDGGQSLKDENGNTIYLDLAADDVKDLGNIHVQ